MYLDLESNMDIYESDIVETAVNSPANFIS